MTEEEELEFEAEHDVPVRAGGSVVVAAWGTALAVLFVGIAFTALLLSYFYLRLENEIWPPPGIPDPQWLVAVATSVIMLLSAGTMYRAVRRIRAGDQQGLRRGIAGALVLGLAALALLWNDLATAGFSPTEHAYGSILFTLGGFVIAVAGGTLIAAAMTLVWSLQGHYSARRHAHVINVARFFAAMVTIWLIGTATLYAAPYLS